MKLFSTLVFTFLISIPKLVCSENLYSLQEKSATISFEAFDKLILTRASANGQNGYFILDTGNGDLSLNDRYFEGRLPTEKKATSIDVNGQERIIRRAWVEDFHWEGVERRKFAASLIDLSHAEANLKVKILGLIGYEVLKDFELVIDYDDLTITLINLDNRGRPAAPAHFNAPHHSLSFELNGHIPVIQAAIGDGRLLRFGIDSGANFNILDSRFKRKLEGEAIKKYNFSYRGLHSPSINSELFLFESITLENQIPVKFWKSAFIDISGLRHGAIHLDGILGVNFFRFGKVAVNYRSREIRIWMGDNVFAKLVE